MGIREADIDGIKHFYDPNRWSHRYKGTEVFLVPCSRCGQIIYRTEYGRKKKYVCDECKFGEKQERKIEQKKRSAFVDQLYDVITTKEERRFDKAVDNINRQTKNPDSYAKDIEIARRGQFKYGSVPEAMTAIELIHLGYSIIPQQKVGRYHVDFYLPKEKIVLEVDGSVYHHGEVDGDREAVIQFSLGLDTRIVHIPAETISKNVHIIKKVMKKISKEP